MEMNIEDLTIGELLIFEEVSGKPIGEIGSKPGAKDLQGLAYVFLLRENPEATLEDAAAVKVSSLVWSKEDPTDATA